MIAPAIICTHAHLHARNPTHLQSAGSDAARRRLVLSMLRQGSARLTLQDRAGNTAMHLAFDLAGDQEVGVRD